MVPGGFGAREGRRHFRWPLCREPGKISWGTRYHYSGYVWLPPLHPHQCLPSKGAPVPAGSSMVPWKSLRVSVSVLTPSLPSPPPPTKGLRVQRRRSTSSRPAPSHCCRSSPPATAWSSTCSACTPWRRHVPSCSAASATSCRPRGGSGGWRRRRGWRPRPGP